MILLDTCVIVWDALKPTALSKTAQAALKKAKAARELALSEISFWEIAMLVKKGRLDLGTDYQSFIDLVLKAESYTVWGLTPEIADTAVNLPNEINPDPADRIIAATAIKHSAPLVTADKNLRKAKILKTIW